MPDKYRREDIQVKGDDSYITIHQHPGEKPTVVVHLFEGELDIKTAIARQKALTKAIRMAKRWRAEGG